MESNTNQPEEMKIESTRKLKVKTINNQVYNLEVQPNILVSELKKEIETVSGVPVDKQRLIYMAKVLHDEQTLDVHVTDDDQTIHLLAKTQTDAPSQPQFNPQAQNQPSSAGQPSQQAGAGNPGVGLGGNIQGGVFVNAGGAPQNMPIDLGGLLGGLGLGNLGPILGGVIGGVNQGNNQQQGPNAPGADQQAGASNPNQQGGQPQNPVNAQVRGVNITIAAAADPFGQNPMMLGQPQVRVLNTDQLRNLIPGANIAGSPLNPQQQAPFSPSRPEGQNADPNRPRSESGNAGRTVIELPHRNVFNIGNIVNSLMGPQSAFPGPPMPQLQVQRNGLVLMGGFLYNFQFQVGRLLPFLSRLADLLQRESLITNPNERHQVELLSHSMANALDEISQATGSVAHLFRNLQMGSNPGEFRLSDRRAGQQASPSASPNPSSQQQQQQPQSAAPQNPFAGLFGQPGQANALPINLQNIQGLPSGLQNIGSILAGAFPQAGQQRPQAQAQSQPQPSAQQQSQPADRRDQTEIEDETEELNRNRQANISAPVQRPQAQAQPQTQVQQEPAANPLAGMGNMGGMMGMLSAMGPGLMNQSISSMLGESREGMSDAEEQLMVLLGNLTMGDGLALLTAGNTDCFDRIHPEMQESIRALLPKYGGMENLVKSSAQSFASVCEVREEHQSRVMEGFEPQLVAEEISEKHIAIIFANIMKDYEAPEKFSDVFSSNMKDYIRELLSEVSEGLNDGINDLHIILRDKLTRAVSNMAGGSGMEGMVMAMVWPQIWQKIMKIYVGEQAPVVAQASDSAGEEDLLRQIANAPNPDEASLPNSENLSEAYKKGGLDYKDEVKK